MFFFQDAHFRSHFAFLQACLKLKKIFELLSRERVHKGVTTNSRNVLFLVAELI